MPPASTLAVQQRCRTGGAGGVVGERRGWARAPRGVRKAAQGGEAAGDLIHHQVVVALYHIERPLTILPVQEHLAAVTAPTAQQTTPS